MNAITRILQKLGLRRVDYSVLLLIVVLRLALIGYVYPDESKIFNGDSKVYHGLAVEFLEHDRYYYPPYGEHSDIFRTPGYPAALIACYAVFGIGVYLAPLLLNVVGVCFLYVGIIFLLRKVGAPGTIAAAVIFACDLAWLFYTKELVAEPLFTPLLVWSIVAFIDGVDRRRIGMQIIAGALLAICAFIKPIVLYLPVPLTLYAIVRMRSLLPPLVFGIVFLAGISPWLVRNKIVHDTFAFTSIQSANIGIGHAAYVYADIHDLPYSEAVDSMWSQTDRAIATLPDASFRQIDSIRYAQARKILGERPFVYIASILRGMAITLFDPGRLTFERTFPADDHASGLTEGLATRGLIGTLRSLLEKRAFTALVLGPYFVFLAAVAALCCLGVVPFWRDNKAHCILIALIGGYLLVLGGPNGYARFRLYILPFMLVFAGYGMPICAALWNALRLRFASADRKM